MSKHSEELTRSGRERKSERRGEEEKERTRELLSGTAKRVVSAVINGVKCLNAIQLSQRKGAMKYYFTSLCNSINIITFT